MSFCALRLDAINASVYHENDIIRRIKYDNNE